MITYILQIVAAFIGSLGFALLFNVRQKLLFPASLGGILCWVVYLLCQSFNAGIFMSSVITAMAVSFYAQIFARACKTPSTLFYIPAIIPLIPGSSLFYTMYNAVTGDRDLFVSSCISTVFFACGIAVGTAFIYGIFIIHSNLTKKTALDKRRTRKESNFKG